MICIKLFPSFLQQNPFLKAFFLCNFFNSDSRNKIIGLKRKIRVKSHRAKKMLYMHIQILQVQQNKYIQLLNSIHCFSCCFKLRTKYRMKLKCVQFMMSKYWAWVNAFLMTFSSFLCICPFKCLCMIFTCMGAEKNTKSHKTSVYFFNTQKNSFKDKFEKLFSTLVNRCFSVIWLKSFKRWSRQKG